MSIFVDIAVLAIILLCTFIQYKRGLIKVAFSLLSFVIAIVIALIFCKPITNYIITDTKIDDSIQESISSHLFIRNENSTNSSLSIAIPEVLMSGANQTAESISEMVTQKLIQLVVLLLIFIIAKIILHFVTFLADMIAKLPILKQFNELGGLIYGILQGFAIVYALLAVISLIAPVCNFTIVNYINDSIIASKLYNHNILLNILL